MGYSQTRHAHAAGPENLRTHESSAVFDIPVFCHLDTRGAAREDDLETAVQNQVRVSNSVVQYLAVGADNVSMIGLPDRMTGDGRLY